MLTNPKRILGQIVTLCQSQLAQHLTGGILAVIKLHGGQQHKASTNNDQFILESNRQLANQLKYN